MDQKKNKILKSLDPSFAEIYSITRKMLEVINPAFIFIWIDNSISDLKKNMLGWVNSTGSG
jgi:hypothetical protein